MALLTLGEEEIIELDMEGMLKVCVRGGGCFLAKGPLWSSSNIPWQLDAVLCRKCPIQNCVDAAYDVTGTFSGFERTSNYTRARACNAIADVFSIS